MKRPATLWRASGIAILIWLVAFSILSSTGFSDKPWQGLLLNLTYALAAAWSAWRASRLWRRFMPADAPRAIWRFFAMGLWSWAVAELLFAVLARIYGEALAVVTLADLAWVTGCLFLIVALVLQFRVLHRFSPGQIRWLVGAVMGGLLLLSGGVAWLVPQLSATELTRAELFLLVFYPLSDLFLAIGALYAARFFGQGQLGRAWYALFLFAVSDTLYTWLLSEGVYVLVGSSNFLTLLTNVMYIAAYLLLGWMCQAQDYLLLYGPRWRHRKMISSWERAVEG